VVQQRSVGGPVARFDVELLYFIFNKKPDELKLSFTRMCISKGYFYVLNWWKEMELLELFCKSVCTFIGQK
jgi:hypothetical protein